MTSLQRFNDLAANASFIFAVFFRGHWCPFCLSYLKDLEALVPEIKRANGVVVAVTAEADTYLPQTLSKTKFSGEVILDPNLDLITHLRNRKLINISVTKKGGYAQGMIQPGVLVVGKDGEAIYSWALEPSMMNLGGAKDRVALDEVWEDVQAILNGKATGPRTQYSKTGMMSGLKQQILG